MKAKQQRYSTYTPTVNSYTAAWRQFVNYATLPISLYMAFQLSATLNKHNLIASNNFGLLQHTGIIAIPFFATFNQWPLAINDFIHNTFGIDWIENDFNTLRAMFGYTKTKPQQNTTTNHTKTTPTCNQKCNNIDNAEENEDLTEEWLKSESQDTEYDELTAAGEEIDIEQNEALY